LDRSVLSDLAIHDQIAFGQLVQMARQVWFPKVC
jgi:ribosomal protein L20